MNTIIGSHDLWLTPEVAGAIVAVLADMNPSDAVGVRASRAGELASPVEKYVADVAARLGHPVTVYAPEKPGRDGVFYRDFTMAEASDKVFAYFAPEQEMEGGTGHVVKAALDRGVPVEAYGLGDDGGLILLGSDDGDPARPILRSRPDVLARMWEETTR